MRLIDADALMERLLEWRERIRHMPGDSIYRCGVLDQMAHDKAEIEDAPTVGGWVSVEKSLPEPGVNVLVYMERDAWPDSGYCRKRDIEKGWQINGRWHCDGCSRVEGLYWMPLPEAPPEVNHETD